MDQMVRNDIACYCIPIVRIILESCVLTHLSTILSLMKFSCKDGLSCTVYVTNEHIVHQLKLLFFILYWPYS